MRYLILSCLLLCASLLQAQTTPAPDKLYGVLFTDVQESGIFPDSKTFVDCIPKKDPAEILSSYIAIKNNPAIRFSLEMFVTENFIIPQTPQPELQQEPKDIVTHINDLWTVLSRKSDSTVPGSSLLPLPYDYIVPGGRFREIYYWDSYFTMLGLKESREYDMMENMVKNFAFLINKYGHVPNGNRNYYLSRSQPPFFSLMIELLSDVKGEEVYVTYLPELEAEYNYWMDRTAKTSHVVKMKNGAVLNRYWDQLSIPRQEAWAEDKKLVTAKRLYPESEALLYRNLRSAAESGWDFSSRWMKDSTLASTETTNIIPVDLNCLLLHLERSLALAHNLSGNNFRSRQYNQFAIVRRKAINTYCWSAAAGWYTDYNLRTKKPSPHLTLAGMYPLFFKISDSIRSKKAASLVAKKFFKSGGLITSLKTTGQQWDAPNGWAPLQWIAIVGLENTGSYDLAQKIATRWYALNMKWFMATGKLMEKYDVIHTDREGGGGEYPAQDGFGWTNGVLLALMKKYKLQ